MSAQRRVTTAIVTTTLALGSVGLSAAPASATFLDDVMVETGRLTQVYFSPEPGVAPVTFGTAGAPGTWYLPQGTTSLPVYWVAYASGDPAPTSCQPHVAFDGAEQYTGPAMPASAGPTLTPGWALFSPGLMPNTRFLLDSPQFQAFAAEPRSATVTVSLDCGAVGSATWAGNALILPSSPDGRDSGVSIDDGADFTNTPKVRLYLGWRGLVDKVKVSNDGGFAPSRTQVFDLTGTEPLPWTLVELANERIPRQVYVKFHQAGSAENDWSTASSDDIVLDTVRPTVTAASLTAGGTLRGSAAPTSSATLRISAKDNRSGIRSMQVSSGKPSRKTAIQAFRARVAVRSAGRPVYVRVRDGAGNWSRWRAAG